ncbi:MAG: hypothetical protein KatS3mg123_0932 [Burkholderiales bacterium]|nr:MAG: hypothetical protein KatS3mg123_0932 [Burkholderiales bacterium]
MILNDNEMSISENVGAMNRYLVRLLSSRFYHQAREAGRRMLEKLPPVLELAKKAEDT